MSTAIKPFDETLRSHLWASKTRIVAALDGQIDFDRFGVVAMNAVRRLPKLAECDVASVVESISKCAELGLEPSGPLGHAYLVPYKKECKLVIGYKGWLHLMFRGGGLADAEAHVVYEDDLRNGFRMTFGSQTIVKHPFNWKPESQRGARVGAYAVLRFTNGGRHVEAMTAEQVEKVMRSSPSHDRDDSPWKTWPDEMWKKTPLKRGAKWAPTGRDYTLMARAHDYDAEGEVVDAPAAKVVELKTVAPPKSMSEGGVARAIEPSPEASKAPEPAPRESPPKAASPAAASDGQLPLVPPAAATEPKPPPTPEQLEEQEFLAITRELYAAETLAAVDAVSEKYVGWKGSKRSELAARFKDRRKELERRGKTRSEN